MPGYEWSVVKCEPLPSDEDDAPHEFSRIFLNDKLCSNYSSIESVPSETIVSNEDTTHLLHLEVSHTLEELGPPAPAGPAATPVCVKQEPVDTAAYTLETLESTPSNAGSLLLERHLAMLQANDDSVDFVPLQPVKDEPTSEGEQQHISSDEASDSCGLPESAARGSPKTWTQQDMDNALDALRNHNMSLTKASARFGIPSTTLWQRAHRLGIETPKKEGGARGWSDADLRRALRALRAGHISANKASKAYGIPSSTLYKIARREGIRLAAPFNAAPVSWRRCDLPRALAAIRAGAASVQRAATQYGIPTGTLYGRCKREGIELSRSNPTPWSEDAMGEALEAVRIGQMSINQAAIHFNLPYSSLYGRFKRCKYQPPPQMPQEMLKTTDSVQQNEVYYHQTQLAPPAQIESDQGVTTEYQSYSQDYSHEIQHGVIQESYTQPMYYQGFNSIVTS